MTSGLDWYYQARERASRPTYQAQQGANWWTMAQQIYGNPGMAGVLSKANPNTYTIRAGQQVNAPKYENTMAGVRAYDATQPEPRRRLRWGEPQPMPPGGYQTQYAQPQYAQFSDPMLMARSGVVGGASGPGGYVPQYAQGLGVAGADARYNRPGIPQYAQGLGVAGAGGMNMPGARLPGSQPQYPSWYQPYGPYGYSMYAPYGPYQPPPYQYNTEQAAPPSSQAGGGYSPPRGGGGRGGGSRSTGYGPGRMFDTAGQYNTALLGSTSWRI